MVRQQWRLTSAVAGGDGGRQRLTAAMDEGGRLCLTVAMDSSCGSSEQLRRRSMVAVVVMVDDGSSVPWRSMVVAIDYGKAMVRQRWPAQ